MTKKTLMPFLYLILLSTIYSCDKPLCENQNPIFDKYEMDSKEYKTELRKQISVIGQNNLRYWFDEYIKEANHEFMVVYIQNESLCAKGKILVRDWGKFIGLRTKNKGYGGAELKGLRLEFEENPENVEFVFQSMESIRD